MRETSKHEGARDRGLWCLYSNHLHSRTHIYTQHIYISIQDFKGITKWILPSEDEAEEVAPIMEGIIKVKLGIDDLDDDEEEEE